MAIGSLAALVEMLRQSGLLEPAQLDPLLQSLHEHPRKPEQVTEELVRQGSLTAYQAEQLLQGQAAELILGPYAVLERVGTGQVSHVFRARHRQRGHEVALKVIRKDLRGDLRVLQRFRREVRALARLSHPNLIRARDVEEIGNAHFYAMEFVAGHNLDELIKNMGPLPIGPACDYTRQAALALQHAHEHGLIHRDIKPANLLVDRRTAAAADRQGRWGTIKLLDLGLSLQQPVPSADARPNLTLPGFTLGTVDYMAPEQVLRPHEVDVRADLYGLGCVCYEMLAGRPPFPEGSMVEKLDKHRREEPPPLEELRPEVPPALAGVVRKMMAKRPEARYQTPADLADVLAKILARLDPTLLTKEWQPPTVARKTSKTALPSRKRVTQIPPEPEPPLSLWWLVGLIVLVFLVSFVVFRILGG